jgi:hypothetical protein
VPIHGQYKGQHRHGETTGGGLPVAPVSAKRRAGDTHHIACGARSTDREVAGADRDRIEPVRAGAGL